MANHIHEIDEQIRVRTEQLEQEAKENFDQDTTLTDKEQARLEELAQEKETVVKQVSDDGTEVTIPLDDFSAGFDSKVKEIKDIAGNMAAKAVHVGDIKRTVEDVKEESRARAIKAFKELSVMDDDDVLTDEELVAINNSAIAAVQEYLRMDRLDSDEIVRRMRKLTLRQLVEILPKPFIDLYTLPAEVKANNLKAKERLLLTLSYLSVTGPEMDYLNDYIDHENKLMILSNRIVECQLDMVKVLQDKDKMSEVVARADELSPQDRTSIWSKYVSRDPRAVHNEFAQLAVMETVMKESYEKIMEEYKDDPECMAQIQRQIDECDCKYEVYLSVTNLETMQRLMDILAERFKNNKKNSWQNLRREGVAAIDRIRRSKLNVHFPVYDATAAKNAENLFTLYIAQYPEMLVHYNDTVRKILDKGEENATDVVPIEIPGVYNMVVYRYFSLILLILYGRIMKALTTNTMTRYQAIELDAYFNMYCKLGKDVYLMTKVWNVLKDFVEYAAKTWPWPDTKTKPKG